MRVLLIRKCKFATLPDDEMLSGYLLSWPGPTIEKIDSNIMFLELIKFVSPSCLLWKGEIINLSLYFT